jgi:anthranilate synthase component 1
VISEAHFHALAKQGYNRIPLVREVLADLDTPLSAYLKVVRGPFAYLFESVQGGEQWGRYSIIGLPARERLEVRAGEVQVFVDDTLTERCRPADPLDWIRAYHRRFRVPQSEDVAGRFAGGLVGYFGFDTVRYIEPRLQRAPRLPDPLDLPEIQLLVAQELLVFDNLRGTLRIIVHADPAERHAYERARARVEALAAIIEEKK